MPKVYVEKFQVDMLEVNDGQADHPDAVEISQLMHAKWERVSDEFVQMQHQMALVVERQKRNFAKRYRKGLVGKPGDRRGRVE